MSDAGISIIFSIARFSIGRRETRRSSPSFRISPNISRMERSFHAITRHDSQPSRYTIGGMSHAPAARIVAPIPRPPRGAHRHASVTRTMPSGVEYTWRPPNLATMSSRNASTWPSGPVTWNRSRRSTHHWTMRRSGIFRDRFPTGQSWRTSIAAA